MRQIVQQQRSGMLQVSEVPVPVLRPTGLLVCTAYSLISAGTERAKVEVAKKNLLGKALARPDQVRQVLQTAQQVGLQATYEKVLSKLEALSPLGYSSAGVVAAVGERVEGFAVGDRVACAGGGYANHAEVAYIPRNLCVRVPDGVGLDEAAYATVGAIALQGVRQAAPLLGETVGVIGLGLLGLLTVQLLRAAGCRVVGFDINEPRCALARQLGADLATTPADPHVETLARRFSPAGLDAVILTAATPSNDPIQLAGQLARDRARVVVVGAVGLDIPRAPFYEKELEVRLSRSYGPGRYDAQYEEKGQDYPIGYVRWTEGRNLAAFLDLLEQRKVDVKMLTTHRFPLAAAEQAYELIDGTAHEPYLGILLDYELPERPVPQLPDPTPVLVRPALAATGRVGIALLGAGNFAQSMLLPHLRRHSAVRLRAVVTPGGLTARSVAERGGFEVAAADAATALHDPEVKLVIVASRHNSHADLAVRGLQAGKAVYVEKPLALTPQELAAVRAAYEAATSPFLMVGFNRRFAPLVGALREFLADVQEPLLLQYRINAGYVARDHWTQDPEEGGGRIIGEMCHFIDLLLYLTGQPPVEVMAQALPDQGRYNRDNVAVLLRFAGGSTGTITYAANGDRGLDKERLEIFGGGRAAVLEDFRELILARNGKRTTRKSSPDKGHRAEMQALVEAVRQGASEPVPFAQAALSMMTTFAVVESVAANQAIAIAPLPPLDGPSGAND
jgi:polar amino acid transport system substrate-binding protein